MQTLKMNEIPVAGRAGRDLLVTSAAMTPDGTTWFVISSRLYRLDVHKKLIEQVPGVENAGLLCRGRDGGLWLSTMKPGKIIPHVAHFDPGTGLITRYERDTLPGEGTYGAGAISLLEDRNGEVWFGTFGRGLFRLTPQSKTLPPLFQRAGYDRDIEDDGHPRVAHGFHRYHLDRDGFRTAPIPQGKRQL